MAIYIDHCGTTPLAREVRDAMVEFMDHGPFANPAAHHHAAGRAAYEALETARAEIAACLNAKPEWVHFTGGASEANNIIIHGFARRFRHHGCRILVGATEHKSVLDSVLDLKDSGYCEVETIPVGQSDGLIDLKFLEQRLADNVEKKITLVAVMWSNNEVPARNPVEEIAALCQRHGALWHCDAVQGIVREKVDVQKLGASSIVFAPHKIYGPKGIGVFVVPERNPMLRLDAPFQGGEQERKMRPGTVNTLAIVGTAAAVKLHETRRDELLAHLRACDEAFVETMTREAPGFHLTIPRSARCPGIVNFHVDGVDAQSLVHAISGEVCANRGASCSGAGGEKVRHVPKALGLPLEVAANVIRVSFGFENSLDDARRAAEIFAKEIRTTRKG